MVRIHFAEREPREYHNVTEIVFADGGVILRRQPLVTEVDPQDIRVKRTVPAGPPRLLGAFSRDAHWVEVEEIEDEPESEHEVAPERPALEVAH